MLTKTHLEGIIIGEIAKACHMRTMQIDRHRMLRVYLSNDFEIISVVTRLERMFDIDIKCSRLLTIFDGTVSNLIEIFLSATQAQDIEEDEVCEKPGKSLWEGLYF